MAVLPRGPAMTQPFATPLAWCGPLRQPRQMLAEQTYGGHKSIHDDDTAASLGLRAGPIEEYAPLSLTTYQTKAALRNIKLTALPAAAK